MQKNKKRKDGKPLTLRERSILETRWCTDSKGPRKTSPYEVKSFFNVHFYL